MTNDRKYTSYRIIDDVEFFISECLNCGYRFDHRIKNRCPNCGYFFIDKKCSMKGGNNDGNQ